MAFHFSLAAVLRLRESIEQHEHLILEKRQLEIVAFETKLQRATQAHEAAIETRKAELAKGMRAAHLHSACEYEKALEMEREALRAQLTEARFKWQQQLHTYQTARRKRETLESLKSKQLEFYNREQAKREQHTLDDLFLARRGRRG